MGKHKKFLKSEKAKVKLKGTKLKTAQNVTKTDFKVRKIIIPDQIKNVKKDEITGLKQHSVQVINLIYSIITIIFNIIFILGLFGSFEKFNISRSIE